MPRPRREPPVVVIGLDGPLSEALLRAARARRRKPAEILADVVETDRAGRRQSRRLSAAKFGRTDMAKKNGNGKSGRPKKPAPAPDSYRSDRYKDFLHRIDANASDLNGARAHQRELIKAEANQGMNKRAHEFVQKLRTAVRNDKMTAQDAIATLECVDTYAEWAGLKDQGDMLRGDDKPSAEETVAAKATGKNGSGGKAEGAFKKA